MPEARYMMYVLTSLLVLYVILFKVYAELNIYDTNNFTIYKIIPNKLLIVTKKCWTISLFWGDLN